MLRSVCPKCKQELIVDFFEEIVIVAINLSEFNQNEFDNDSDALIHRLMELPEEEFCMYSYLFGYKITFSEMMKQLNNSEDPFYPEEECYKMVLKSVYDQGVEMAKARKLSPEGLLKYIPTNNIN